MSRQQKQPTIELWRVDSVLQSLERFKAQNPLRTRHVILDVVTSAEDHLERMSDAEVVRCVREKLAAIQKKLEEIETAQKAKRAKKRKKK